VIRLFPLDVFYGRQIGGDTPFAAGDAGDARFVARDVLASYPLTERCEELVRAAWQRLSNAA
jgi:hypothetical protein